MTASGNWKHLPPLKINFSVRFQWVLFWKWLTLNSTIHHDIKSPYSAHFTKLEARAKKEILRTIYSEISIELIPDSVSLASLTRQLFFTPKPMPLNLQN